MESLKKMASKNMGIVDINDWFNRFSFDVFFLFEISRWNQGFSVQRRFKNPLFGYRFKDLAWHTQPDKDRQYPETIATDSESVHQHLFEEAEHKYSELRFNVERDVGDIGLQEWKKSDKLTAHTMAYMNLPQQKRDKIECSKWLIDPVEFYSMYLW